MEGRRREKPAPISDTSRGHRQLFIRIGVALSCHSYSVYKTTFSKDCCYLGYVIPK